MSPASKSKKSKDKASAKAAKEQQKASSKSSGSTNTVSGSPASAYNPLSGTFHTLEIPSAASSPPFHDNGRFRNIDDTDEHSSSPHGTVSEYDSVSNNGSCSGESEDPKEKIFRQDTVPGLDNDRREKIRLKNEKKHQRQRERRAQELHERCSGFLMSRKLESLSQQLVAMGFSHERATLALVLNEGRVEQSVNWLFEGNEEEARNKDTKRGSSGNLKIDISDELAQLSTLEVRYKCSRQEVERAVVACEGDLLKAEEIIQAQKQEPPATPPQEETVDANNMKRPQEKPMSSASVTIQQKRNDRDFNYSKAAISVSTYSEPGSRNLQSINQPKSLAERRWTAGSSSSFSSSMVPPMQVQLPAGKLEVGVSGNEGKNHQQILREPVVVMQRPQSINAKQNEVPSITYPVVTAGWYSNIVPGIENVRSNGKLLSSQNTGSFGLVNQSAEQFYHPASYKESSLLLNGPVDPASAGLGGSWSSMGKHPSLAAPYVPRGSYGIASVSSPSLAAPSSLGLFTGVGSSGTLGTSHVDWNNGGSMPEFDYTSIDWTLDTNLSSSKRGLWLGLSSLLSDRSGARMNSMNSSCISGLREAGAAKEMASSVGLREWTSPFAGKDIFSLPRQFVTSPSP
ncbi:uncharacterized protein LOC8276315 [Ricinus communis]|uniref:UBA domain-containing protein n=1 Tax=Ricinus communis TaxID=3988 RepID=B9SHT8_RICCO|nr:uncharacterized protein LOC8276315 [Ricinus communis]XP_015578729.1 uncharacterized protein LOC8276315 [Ricinus communis]EEF36816.1 conserved hypothetical protein [Ricinus communis]|eukprot:XP_002525557.1 uncharacterized protein LOC8276315 [Ricinus communis]